MKAIRAPLLPVMLVLATAAGARAQAAPAGFREEFLRQFNNSMQKFVEFAEAMPEDRYGWSPAEGVMTVARCTRTGAATTTPSPRRTWARPRPVGWDADSVEQRAAKAEVVDLLRRSREHVRTAVTAMSDAQPAAPTRLYGRDVPRWAVLLQLLAHMNEHLGQSIAYARMNGVVPPWSQ